MGDGRFELVMLLSGALLLLVPAVIAAIIFGVVRHERRKAARDRGEDGSR